MALADFFLSDELGEGASGTCSGRMRGHFKAIWKANEGLLILRKRRRCTPPTGVHLKEARQLRWGAS